MQQNPQTLSLKSNVQSYCTKYNQCLYSHENSSPNDSSQFSIDSQYLKQQTPFQIEIQPEIQIQVKPNIDILISTNLKMNKYKNTFQKYPLLIYSQELKSNRKKSSEINNLKNQTNQLNKRYLNRRRAINKVTISGDIQFIKTHPKTFHNGSLNLQLINNPRTPKIKIYKTPLKKQNKESLNSNKKFQKNKNKNKVIISHIHQEHQEEQKEKKLDNQKIKQVNVKITQNAEQILKKKQAEIQETKKKKQEIKRKISQLQKQSLTNCKKSKQNPLNFQSGKQDQFRLQQSQYSTFQARKQGRKMVKKEKKKKNVKQNNETKLVTEINSRRNLREKVNRTVPHFNKSKKPQKQKQNINNQQQEQQPDTKKQFNRFYVWNVPIKHQDYSLVVLDNRLSEEQKSSLEKNKSQANSFKQQAEEYLRQKEAMEIEARREKGRQELLLQKIAEKKGVLMKQYQEMYMRNIND